MPTTRLEGEGPVVSVPEHDFAFVHGWADMALCKLPIPRDGKKPRRVSGEQNVLVNGYLLINKQQIQALKARQILSDSTKAKTYALVFNRPVPKNFSMPEFIQQQATEEAQVLADLRPFL